MVEEKIIKALKLHASEKSKCLDCPYYHEQACSYDMAIDALDLINRQKAELERLTEMLNATIAGQETLQKYIAQRSPLEMVADAKIAITTETEGE